jgi:hypothetical protein
MIGVSQHYLAAQCFQLVRKEAFQCALEIHLHLQLRQDHQQLCNSVVGTDKPTIQMNKHSKMSITEAPTPQQSLSAIKAISSLSVFQQFPIHLTTQLEYNEDNDVIFVG